MWVLTSANGTPIMCGGAGTRLWPRENRPKQSSSCRSGRYRRSRKTIRRVSHPALFWPAGRSNEQYRFLVAEQLAAISVRPTEIRRAAKTNELGHYYSPKGEVRFTRHSDRVFSSVGEQPELIGRRLNAHDQCAKQNPDISPEAPVIDIPNV
jgi:hypothetical protein